MKSVILKESDRELVWMAARLLMAQQPGPGRLDVADQLAQHYRDDLAEAHPGVDPATLDEMTVNFGGALLLEMERLADSDDDDAEPETPSSAGAALSHRRRVMVALGQMLAAIDPRH